MVYAEKERAKIVRSVFMARRIVVTSGKGGVGKTTLAVCLGAQLALKGWRVVLCDGDFGLNNVDVLAGVDELAIYDVVDVIEGRCRAKQALVRHPKYPNLHILAARTATSERYISPQALKIVLDGLSPAFDFILIDCPTGLDEGFHRAVGTADEAIVVTTPHLIALRDADKTVTLLKSYRLQGVSLVVNRVRGDLLAAGECLTPTEIATLLNLPLAGVIPETDGERLCLASPHPAFKRTACLLATGKGKPYDVTRKYKGLFGNIRRALKRRL
jgi:septum site-determining protein MinD